jgi:DNA-binding HxlR family transcriptional regulator
MNVMKKRNYKQNCALALAADMLCERWTLLIFRELLIQPCRFKELNEWLAGMGTNLLAARLKELEAAGLVSRQKPGDKRSAYLLTEEGLTIEPIIFEMLRWGHGRLAADKDSIHRHHWDLLAIRALFKQERCKQKITLQFDTVELIAWVQATPEGLVVKQGRTEHPDATITMTITDFQRAISADDFADNPIIQKFVAYF